MHEGVKGGTSDRNIRVDKICEDEFQGIYKFFSTLFIQFLVLPPYILAKDSRITTLTKDSRLTTLAKDSRLTTLAKD